LYVGGDDHGLRIILPGLGAKGGIVRRLTEDKSGVTAIEYGLIAALIAVAAVVVMGTVGTNLSTVFSEVASSL
jgi:pilus assembly protein Flp/PilA